MRPALALRACPHGPKAARLPFGPIRGTWETLGYLRVNRQGLMTGGRG